MNCDLIKPKLKLKLKSDNVGNICDICYENEKHISTSCLNKHAVCLQCYKKLEYCPFCRIIYKCSYYCKYGENHKFKGIEEQQRSIYLFTDLSEEKDVMYKFIENIKCDTFMIPSFNCDCLCDELECYCFDLKGVFEETLNYLSLRLKQCMENMNILIDTLPLGIKIYISKLSDIDSNKWEKNLGNSVKNVIIRLANKKHLKYLFANNQIENDTKKKLYRNVCSCIADEYLLYQIITKEWCNFMPETEIINNISSSCIGYNFTYELMIQHFPRPKMQQYFGLSETINMEIAPCDWFEKYKLEDIDLT